MPIMPSVRATALCLALALGGWRTMPCTTFDLLSDEVGSSIADATLVAGMPDWQHDLPSGQRAFVWNRPILVPTSPHRCNFTAYAVRTTGDDDSLAAWEITQIAAPARG